MAAPTWVKNGTRLTKSGGGASALAPTISCTIGNYIVALFEFNVFGSTTAISTPSGWTLLHSRAPSGAQTYKPQVAAFGKVATSTTETCSITTVGSDTYGYGQLSEWSGVASVDTSASTSSDNADGTATSLTLTAAAALAVADSAILAHFTAETGGGGTSSVSSPASSGYTVIGTNANDSATIGYDASRKTVAVTTAPTAGWTWSGASRWSAGMVVLSGSGGGSSFSGDAADSLTASETETALATFASARAESLTAAETPAATMIAPVATAESLTAADSSTASITSPVVESLTAASAQTATLNAVSAIAEAGTAADTNAATASFVGAQAETLTASDAEAVTMAAPVARAESLTAAAAQDASVTSAGVSSASDTLSASDAASAVVSFSAARAEALAATDAQSAVAVFAVVRVESLAALDAIVASAVLQGIRIEVLAAADALGAIAMFSGSVADVLAASAIATAVGGSVSPPSYLPNRLRVVDPTTTLACVAPSLDLSVADMHTRALVIDPTSTLEVTSISSTSDLTHG